MKTNLIILIICILCSCSVEKSCFSSSQSNFLSRIGKMKIPFLTRRISVDYSVDLISQPMTMDDVATFWGQKLNKIGADLVVAGGEIKGLGVRFLNYVKANPADAALLAGGVAAVYLLGLAIMRGMAPARCPHCTRCHHCGECHHNFDC